MKQGNHSEAGQNTPKADVGQVDTPQPNELLETKDEHYHVSNDYPIRVHEADIEAVVMLGYD